MVKSGHPQPYHTADLDHLRRLSPTARSVLGARADGTALQALLTKAAPGTAPARIYAAFARGAWRQVTGDETLSITLMHPDGTAEDDGGALLLVDLTGTRLTSYHAPEGLVLALATEGQAITLTLSYDEQSLPFATAAAWINELAARIDDPIRQLL